MGGVSVSLKVGKVIRFERTFTKEDVKGFTKLSKDEGRHHTTPDEVGRLVVQGLLTATLPTKIGGDYNVYARTMNFDFFRPVFTEDTIVCEVKIQQYEKRKVNQMSIKTIFTCRNQDGKEVLKGDFAGVIFV